MSERNSDGFLRHNVGGCFWGRKPKRVGVAVSGGSDSMALLELLTHWAKENEATIKAVTVDHGLRPEAKDEAAFVAKFCAARDISHDVVTWQGWDGSGNLQAEARDARYKLLADWARETHVDIVAIGHTANDQAETFLMRMARSAGVDGLAAMEREFMRNGIRFARPLLSHPRAELRAYLSRHDLTWIEDPSNADTRFDRVKARAAFEALRDLGISERTITSSTHNLSMGASALHQYTWQEAKRCVEEDRGDLIVTTGPELHVEIERRLTLAALQFIGGERYPARKSALGEMKVGLHEAGKHTLAGCLITRDGYRLRFTRELNAVVDVVAHTELFWDRRWSLDGPHEAGLEVRALGEAGLSKCSDWRETNMPRISLLASPAVWRGDELVAAPIAGFENGWSARPTQFGAFHLGKSA